MQSFFYDDQIRRFLLQFTRIFTGFQIEYGREEGSEAAALLRVPIRYGDATRNAQTILQENSKNSLPSTPLMTFYIAALDYDRPRMQEPYHVSKFSVRQRTWDETTDTYETTQGNAFTVERLMPVPYKLTMNLDLWTSNTNQKLQLLEQILTLFNPSLEIQSTDNYIDWTSLSVVELESVSWSSRSIPVGTENPIDICTLRFNIPIWISSPAKIKKLGVVERVIAGVFNAQGDAVDAITNNDLLLGTRQVITPYNYKTIIVGNRVQVLQDAAIVNGNNEDLAPISADGESNLLWPAVIGLYGTLRPGVSQLRFIQPDDTEIVGTIALDPTDDRFVLFDVDVDTIPGNTMPPINAVIDPLVSGPNNGLPAPANGTRYLLTEATGDLDNSDPATSWLGENGRGLVASANDIIEYSTAYGYWRVVFRAEGQPEGQFVTNLTTGIQYEWVGNQWLKSYQGVYYGGYWRLVL